MIKAFSWGLGALLAGLTLSLAAAAQERTRVLVEPDSSSRAIVDSFQRSLSVVGGGGQSGPQEVSLMMRVEFDFDRDTLRPEARSLLDMVAAALNDPSLQAERFLVEGHTDAVGSEAYNRGLSERRAAAVTAYLAQRGVARDRLAPVGYGWNRLLPGVPPTDGANRRVELLRLGQ